MKRLRRSELFIAFVMIVGGALPGALIYLWLSRSLLAAIVAGVLFWPCAYLSGALALPK